MNLGQSLTSQQTATYLKTLPSIRTQCGKVHELAKQKKLEYFDYHPEREEDVANFCIDIIKRDYGTDFASIPPHGRWRHLDAGRSRVEPLISKWKASPNPPDVREICRRLIDLFLVSVLLDAGAGNMWSYVEPGHPEHRYTRSEGLAVSSINMFEEGFFSGQSQTPYQVDAVGLSRVTAERTAQAMQVTASNPMVGIEGRTSLLQNLSDALRANSTYFGTNARPGNLIDFLESESILGNDGSRRVHVSSLWAVLIEGLAPIWPSTRSSLGGVPLGDVWPCAALKPSAKAEGDDLVPFHKLTGWITYSLIEPIQKILGWTFEGVEDMTGLPEYRNGGLLVDLGVLTLKEGTIPSSFYPEGSELPRLPPSHPAIIEWRAMTVIELDRIADAIRSKLGLTAVELTLAQILESATWKGGREIAKQRRPATGGPPIDIESDGTVF